MAAQEITVATLQSHPGIRVLTIKEFSAIYSVDRRDVKRLLQAGLLRKVRLTHPGDAETPHPVWLGVRIIDPGWEFMRALLYDDVERLRHLYIISRREAAYLLGVTERQLLTWTRGRLIDTQRLTLYGRGPATFYSLSGIIKLLHARERAVYGPNSRRIRPTVVEWALQEIRAAVPDAPFVTAAERRYFRYWQRLAKKRANP